MGEGQNTAGGDSVKDQSIIELFIERSEAAIEETKLKFGRLIYSIAYHIVQDRMDAEECESDTYLSAWNTIPPALPENLKAYLLRIARNLALKQYRHEHTAKRDKRMLVSLDELECCIEDSSIQESEAKEKLTECINDFLAELEPEKRKVFLLKYWYFASVKEIMEECGMSKSTVESMLFRTRKRLKEKLEKEGYRGMW